MTCSSMIRCPSTSPPSARSLARHPLASRYDTRTDCGERRQRVVDGAGAVTAGAAGLAAVLAGVNLHVSGASGPGRLLPGLSRASWTRASNRVVQAGPTSLGSLPDAERDRLRAHRQGSAGGSARPVLTGCDCWLPSRVVKAAEADHKLVTPAARQRPSGAPGRSFRRLRDRPYG